MAQVLPIESAPRQVFASRLNNQPVTVRLWWQPTTTAWYIEIDHGDRRLVTSRQIAPWTRVIGPDPLFDGDILALAAVGYDAADIGRLAWTQSHALWYLTGAEIVDMEAAIAEARQ